MSQKENQLFICIISLSQQVTRCLHLKHAASRVTAASAPAGATSAVFRADRAPMEPEKKKPTAAQEEMFPSLNADNEVTVIESLCMRCQKQVRAPALFPVAFFAS
jgi:hypothetical protein